MKILIHYPKTPQGQNLPKVLMAETHATYVAQQLRMLPCSPEQKKALLEAILQTMEEALRTSLPDAASEQSSFRGA